MLPFCRLYMSTRRWFCSRQVVFQNVLAPAVDIGGREHRHFLVQRSAVADGGSGVPQTAALEGELVVFHRRFGGVDGAVEAEGLGGFLWREGIVNVTRTSCTGGLFCYGG